jgi:Uma2 family endonuclease
MNMLASSPVTAEELLRLSHPGKQVELVRGEVVVREPPAAWHGGISNNVAFRLTAFVRELELGAVFGQDTGFQIAADPDTVRAPDVAFVRAERVVEIPRRSYPRIAPDLVVEVLSPDDRPGDVLAKIGEWLDAGVSLVWVLDPGAAQARVHRPNGSLDLLGATDELDGEDVLPGFRCRVTELLSPGW